jgi:hypothetical protein
MAVPDSLTAWREFVARRNIEPEHLTTDQLAAMTADEKDLYDESRFAWLGADIVIETKDLATIDRQVRIIRARLAAQRSTAGRTLALTGRAGVVDSPVYRLAGQAAGQAVERACLDQRAQQLGFDAPPQELLVYPETVRLACLITDSRFLDVAFTRSPEQQRVEFVTAQVERVLAGHEGSWLAVNPIWQMLHLMYARVRDAELRGGLVADYPWGITRFWRG